MPIFKTQNKDLENTKWKSLSVLNLKVSNSYLYAYFLDPIHCDSVVQHRSYIFYLQSDILQYMF